MHFKIISFILLSVILNKTLYAHPDIIAFVDAGSSGSRMHFYNTTTVPPTEIEACEQRSRARLGDVYGKRTTPEQYGEALAKLFPGHENTPEGCEIRSSSYIVIQSTAGSRVNIHQSGMTLEERRTLEEAIERSVERVLGRNKNSVSLEVISGRFEGLFGWLDTQFAFREAFTKGNSKAFDAKLICGEAALEVCSKRLVFYDLGGMSSQLAWSMKNAYSVPGCKAVSFQSRILGAMRIRVNESVATQESQFRLVYSKSFLGNGMTAFSRVLTKDSPCWLNNSIKSTEDRYTVCRENVQAFMDNTKDQTPERELLNDQWKKLRSQIACDEANGPDAVYVAATLTHYFGINHFRGKDGTVELTHKDFFFNSREEWNSLTKELCSHTMSEKQQKDSFFFNVCGAFLYLDEILLRLDWKGKIFVTKEPKWITGSILYETQSGLDLEKLQESIRYPSFNVNNIEDQPFDQISLQKSRKRVQDRSWIEGFFGN